MGFSLFKGKGKDQEHRYSPAPSAALPTPLWALATEPSARAGGRAFGPRPLSSARQAQQSIDHLAAGVRTMGVGEEPSSPTRRGPLPHLPRHQSTSEPAQRDVLAYPPRPAPQSRANSSPTRARPPLPVPHGSPQRSRSPPKASSSAAASLQSQSTAAGSSGSSSFASTSLAAHSPSRPPPLPPRPPGRPPFASVLYPQALPPPQGLPPPKIPRVSDAHIFRQTVPDSALPTPASTPGSIMLPFPGAYPADSSPALVMPQPRPYEPGAAWAHDDMSFMRFPVVAAPPLPPVPRPSPPQPFPHYPTPPPFPASASPTSARPPLTNYNVPQTPPRCKPANPHRPSPSSVSSSRPPRVIDLCESPDEDGAKNQCHGTTGTGKRCARIVVDSGTPSRKSRGSSPQVQGPSGPLDTLDVVLGSTDGDGGNVDGTTIQRFCFQHADKALADKGCFVNSKSGRSLWVDYDTWILPDLPLATRVSLRIEMAKPVSHRDQPGYIYVHEMCEARSGGSSPQRNCSTTTFLKLGRSIAPVSRLSQWRSQCPSRTPIVRDILPRPSPQSDPGAGNSTSLQFAPQGVNHHHRWERLMLIEVAGRALLEAEKRQDAGNGKVGAECRDCGKTHQELFEVGAEAYEEWVREIVERWMRWCGDILA